MVILVQRWAEKYMAAHPGTIVQVTGGGAKDVVFENDQLTMSWFCQPDPVLDVKPTYAVLCPISDARSIAYPLIAVKLHILTRKTLGGLETNLDSQVMRPDQLDAYAELGLSPTFFTVHTFYWGDWYKKIIGPDKAQQISPIKSALNKGLHVTSHTDAPVALPNLMMIMWTTVNRVSRSGTVMGANECNAGISWIFFMHTAQSV